MIKALLYQREISAFQESDFSVFQTLGDHCQRSDRQCGSAELEQVPELSRPRLPPGAKCAMPGVGRSILPVIEPHDYLATLRTQ